MIGSSLILAGAQRLLKRICHHCKATSMALRHGQATLYSSSSRALLERTEGPQMSGVSLLTRTRLLNCWSKTQAGDGLASIHKQEWMFLKFRVQVTSAT